MQHFDVRFVYEREMFPKGEERKTDLVKEAILTHILFYREKCFQSMLFTP